MCTDLRTKVKQKHFIKHFFLIFFHDLKSCMLCNVKRPDDVTTAESNPVGLRFAIPIPFESIISSSIIYTFSSHLSLTVHAMSVSDHADVLRRVWTEVSERLEAQSVARQMFQCNALTVKELESIQCKSRQPVKASERLLDIVTNQSGNVYGYFMNALKQTGQQRLYEIIMIGSYQGKTVIQPCY